MSKQTETEMRRRAIEDLNAVAADLTEIALMLGKIGDRGDNFCAIVGGDAYILVEETEKLKGYVERAVRGFATGGDDE